MKLYPHNLLADAKEERRQGERAFTMVEIAIAIGVIGFALVAVIGILPAGMSVQKDNREDTTISQDAPFFLDAIRNGSTNLVFYNNNRLPPSTSLDFLKNYVEQITIISNNAVNKAMTTTTLATFNDMTNLGGWGILGLLSTPETFSVSSSNYTITRAIVRSLSGAAVQQNGANQITAFRYQMDIEIVPFVNVAPNSTDFNSYTYGTQDYIDRSNRWVETFTGAPTNGSIYLQPVAGALTFSCFDVKMRFSWPVIAKGDGTYIVGPNHQTYRTMITSAITPAVTSTGSPYRIGDQQLWFFQPQTFATNYSFNYP